MKARLQLEGLEGRSTPATLDLSAAINASPMECSNNLKQMGLALHGFSDTQDTDVIYLSAGGTTADAGPGVGAGGSAGKVTVQDVHFTNRGGDFDALFGTGPGAPGGHVRVFDGLTGAELDADGGHGTHVAGTVGSDRAAADDLTGDAAPYGRPPGGNRQECLKFTFADVLSPAPTDLTDASDDAADGSTIAFGGYIRVKKLTS